MEFLYREDRFMRGELVLRDRLLLPGDVRTPLLAVYDPDSRIVPPASLLDLCALAGSEEIEAIRYHGDTGARTATCRRPGRRERPSPHLAGSVRLAGAAGSGLMASHEKDPTRHSDRMG